MRYYVVLPGEPEAKPILVDVVELPSGQLDVRLDGRKVEVDVLPLARQLSVRVDGRVVDLTTEGAPPDLGLVGSGQRSYVRVESERMRSAEQAKKGRGGDSGGVIKSPMPGRVVKVLVSKGDPVTVGQPLLVVEAMKMENEVKAKAAGTVIDVHVSAGATVEGNAKLLTLG